MRSFSISSISNGSHHFQFSQYRCWRHSTIIDRSEIGDFSTSKQFHPFLKWKWHGPSSNYILEKQMHFLTDHSHCRSFLLSQKKNTHKNRKIEIKLQPSQIFNNHQFASFPFVRSSPGYSTGEQRNFPKRVIKRSDGNNGHHKTIKDSNRIHSMLKDICAYARWLAGRCA